MTFVKKKDEDFSPKENELEGKKNFKTKGVLLITNVLLFMRLFFLGSWSYIRLVPNGPDLLTSGYIQSGKILTSQEMTTLQSLLQRLQESPRGILHMELGQEIHLFLFLNPMDILRPNFLMPLFSPFMSFYIMNETYMVDYDFHVVIGFKIPADFIVPEEKLNALQANWLTITQNYRLYDHEQHQHDFILEDDDIGGWWADANGI